MRSLRVVAAVVSLLTVSIASGHDFSVTDVSVLFKTDGTFVIDMRVDVDALALGVSPSTDDAELVAQLRALGEDGLDLAAERARRTVERRVRPRFDRTKLVPHVAFPDRYLPWIPDAFPPTVLGTTARLTGRVPPGAAVFTFGASRAFGAVRLSIFDQAGGGAAMHLLGPAEDSPGFVLGQPVSERVAPPTLWRFLHLGFTHIVPLGADHVLFVLGLFLLSTRWRPLLWQVTAFTLAHTITLALSIQGVISLPSRPVEVLIALSIAYVALENLVTTELKPWRPVLVFAFGLLHGLGFAAVLRELGLPEGRLVTALFGFNAGVELGQLAVILVAFLVVGRFRERDWYRSRIVLPASAAIAVTGLWWCFVRTFGV